MLHTYFRWSNILKNELYEIQQSKADDKNELVKYVNEPIDR